MMKNLITSSLIFLLPVMPMLAQEVKVRFHVANDSNITKTIAVKDRYLFEQFKKGRVYFRNGSKSEAMLNYSFFHSEIQFIDAKNDTLLLAENDYVSRIVIDDMLFYYVPDKGHIQQIAGCDKVRLGRREKLVITDTEHQTAFGGHSNTSSITSYSSYIPNKGQVQKLKSATNVILRKASTYFWIDQNQRFYPASKSNLLKVFPKHKREINDYCKEHEINFSDEKEMAALLDFCNSFQMESQFF